MAKAQKIGLSLVLLLLVIFARSSSVSTGNAPIYASMQYTQVQHLNEYHKVFARSRNNDERVIRKIKVKIRYKGGEAPLISLQYAFPTHKLTFADIVCVGIYHDHIPEVHSSFITLRGPPSLLS